MFHNVKINKADVEDIYKGLKTFDIRKNDRNYAVGDSISYTPMDDNGNFYEHSIQNINYVITYIIPLNSIIFNDVADDYIVFGIEPQYTPNEPKFRNLTNKVLL